MAGYTAKEVAELVELPRETIWELTRAGILEPDRTSAFYQYSFQDLLILRTAKRADPRRRPKKPFESRAYQSQTAATYKPPTLLYSNFKRWRAYRRS